MLKKFLATNTTPVNKVAGRVMSKGVQYTPSKIVTNDERIAPFKLRDITQLVGVNNFDDLTGVRQGRLVVVGLSAEHQNGIWCCRCDCGTYVPRKSRAIRNKHNFGDRCQSCQHLAFLKRRSIFESTGKEVDVRTM